MRYFLELCIKSVEAALKHIDSEIIVIDNCSHDDSCEMVKRLFPKVKLIENSENLGFSKANNIAVKQAQGKYVCILNPDTIVAEDTFEQILMFSKSHNEIGIVSCRLIDGTGAFLPESKRHIPTPKVAIKKMLGFNNSYYFNEIEDTDIGVVPVFVGAFMCVEKSIYKAVKGFDEDYFMYGEDIDLSYKVGEMGFNNTYFGKTSIIHFKGESTLKDDIYAKRFYGAMQIFYMKHFKSNLVFDLLVGLGVKLVPLFRRSVSPKLGIKNKIVFVSSKMNPLLKNTIAQGLLLQSDIKTYDNQTEYILDNNYLSFKSIIDMISNKPRSCDATFKILPRKSNFILGSNCSKTRGDVISFDDN